MQIVYCTTLNETVVPEVMKAKGWIKTDERGDWDIFYADVHALTTEAGFNFGRLRDRQRVNHFPRHVELTRKDLLAKNLNRAKRQLEQNGRGNELDFFPQTYALPQEYGPFVEAFRKVGGVWIMKPCGRAQGKGIFLINRLSQVTKWQKEAEDKEKIDVPRETYVISKYIDNPYLIERSKFDMRLYVLVLSFTPLRVFLYRDGICRFSREDYSLSKESLKDTSVHLTNVAVQKKQEGKDMKNKLKWSVHSLRVYLATQLGRKRTDAVFDEIQRILIRSLLSVQQVVTQDKHCFEIYGYDILLDSQVKPWLIEVNASPRLRADSPEDHKLKFNMVFDALNLVDAENMFNGRLPINCGGFDAIYDQGNVIQSRPETKSLLGCHISSESDYSSLGGYSVLF